MLSLISIILCIIMLMDAHGFQIIPLKRVNCKTLRMTLRAKSEGQTVDIPKIDAVVARENIRQKAQWVTAVSMMATVFGNTQVVTAKQATEADFITALATCLTSKAVLVPVLAFIEKQNYDGGRTNVNYLLNFLQVQKNAEFLVRAGLEFSENSDGVDAAVEASAQLSNTLIQLDSTIYTVIFIPGDDSGKPPPAAEKYIKSLKGYYKESVDRFDVLLTLGSEEQLGKAKEESAKQIANLEKKSPFLFKVTDKAGASFDPKA
jgi:uncharacterized membrane protein YhaH (DUF805 family)